MALNGNRSACVLGGCGFIGSAIVKRLLDRQFSVRVLDNLSVGRQEALPAGVSFFKGDIRDPAAVVEAIRGCDYVFHFAAPTDVRKALSDARYDMDHGVVGTQHVLESMRDVGVRRIVFASSSCVYGEGLAQPVKEGAGPLLPSSVYGASKLACEGLISAYCRTFGMQSWMFRFPNVTGPGVTHGVVRDFICKLLSDPSRLPIFGDGSQTKTYLWSDECIEGIFSLVEKTDEEINLFNITTRGSTSVATIARLVIEGMGLKDVKLEFSGGAAGWPGDVARITLDSSAASEQGWQARLDSDEAIRDTVPHLLQELLARR